ncbi:MAG: multicopper oxidase family protein [Gammaproteobacteria bacterium]
MYHPRNAPKNRIREAQNARDNRSELYQALTQGQISRRDLLKWGLMTPAGVLAAKHGLSAFAPSAYADVPTGTPPSPTFGAEKYTQPLPRLIVQQPYDVQRMPAANPKNDRAKFLRSGGEKWARRLSYHNPYTNSNGAKFANPKTGVGPMEGRPPGKFFAHQRWQEFFPEKAYVMSVGRIASGTKLHSEMPDQGPDAMWTFNAGRNSRGVLPPPLIKMRYGEPAIVRIYNNLPVDRARNGGFGRNEIAIHNHNAHNASASDGASNTHFFPGQFYDYHWGTCLARHDTINTHATDRRASGPDDGEGLVHVPGDFRELQGTLWFHDHRFFFTAENVYKGVAGALNYYSGPDRGNELLVDGVNHRLPSGSRLPWGNTDFDVNLMIGDMAFDRDGQMFFDIFDTDGFLGDLLHVNYAYAPMMEVLPRKYRLRLLNVCMSRFLQLTFADENGNAVPFQFIANDGNFVNRPFTKKHLEEQGTAERYDVVVDFSRFALGDTVTLVNRLEHEDGRGPERNYSLRNALRGRSPDPAVGGVMKFKVVPSVESVDEPGYTYSVDTHDDQSRVPAVLTEQIPIVQPVRERVFEFKRGAIPEECFPDCGEREASAQIEGFDWAIRVNGESTHALNANRIAAVVPKPGDVEHWTVVNSSSGWDHPVHLHFEEGVTIDRGTNGINRTERRVRKDVWRLGRPGSVKFQVQFGEYGGAYVNHCHNTVHEDNAMLLRFDILSDGGPGREPQVVIAPTPDPQPEGVTFLDPEILPEADPDFEA